MKDTNFILFDVDKKQLKDSEIIKNRKNSILTFYLLKSNLKIIPINEGSQKMNTNTNIKDLIMKCTGAKKPLEKKISTDEHQFHFFDFFNPNNNNNDNQRRDGDESLDRLLNIIQFFQESVIRPIRMSNSNASPAEADEKALRELQDMGFAEDKARQALINSRNDINRATEILLGEMGDDS